MTWLFVLESTLLAIMFSTMIGLSKIDDGVISPHDILYRIIPSFLKDLITNAGFLKFISWVIILFTFFFSGMIGFLTVIQVINFTKNKTTKELYSKKPPAPKKGSVLKQRLLSAIPESPDMKIEDGDRSLTVASNFGQP